MSKINKTHARPKTERNKSSTKTWSSREKKSSKRIWKIFDCLTCSSRCEPFTSLLISLRKQLRTRRRRSESNENEKFQFRPKTTREILVFVSFYCCAEHSSGACVEFLIVTASQSYFNCWVPRIVKRDREMLALILFVIVQPFLLFFFFRTQKELPKSWREFKFELQTIFCGLRSQNEDLFLMRRNRISWDIFVANHRRPSLNVICFACRTDPASGQSRRDNRRKSRHRLARRSKAAEMWNDCGDGWDNRIFAN